MAECRVFIGCPRELTTGQGGGLGKDTTDQHLEQYFSQFGEVAEVIRLRWQKSGNKKSCGYIKFKHMDSVNQCLNLRQHEIGGRYITSYKARPKPASVTPGSKVCFNNFLFFCTLISLHHRLLTLHPHLPAEHPLDLPLLLQVLVILSR